MESADKNRFVEALAALREVLGGQPLSQAAIRGYWIALAGLSLSLIHI